MPGPRQSEPQIETGAARRIPDLTRLIRACADGDAQASEELIPIVYQSLRSLARQLMTRETPSHTLQPTALVHEAYVRLVKDEAVRWQNRRHFFGAAAEAMRRILIERARRYGRAKHGDGFERVPYAEDQLVSMERAPELLALDEALSILEAEHPRKATVVKLRYFVGFTIEETARALELSPATIKLEWAYARACSTGRFGD